MSKAWDLRQSHPSLSPSASTDLNHLGFRKRTVKFSGWIRVVINVDYKTFFRSGVFSMSYGKKNRLVLRTLFSDYLRRECESCLNYCR